MVNKNRLFGFLWSWNDYVWTLVILLLPVFLLVAIAQQKETPKETDRSAGNVSVYTFWRQGDIDVDTHLRDPEGEHVFFNHRAGKVWNLLRDDLGNGNDLTPQNFENAYARGLPPGEYIVNVHAYRNTAGYPVDVDGELRIQRNLEAGSAVTFNAHATLDHVGDEATLFRFQIDGDGNLVPGSVNNLFTPLAKEKDK